MQPIGDEKVKVLAIFPVSEVMRKWGPVMMSGLFPLACLPCFWPHLLFASPCLFASYQDKRYLVDNLYYVLTEDGPYVYRRDSPVACCSCCVSTGHDHAKMAWVRLLYFL